MTNLLATLTLVAVTNWTGYIAPDGQETGLVCTNHIASVVYRGKTNTMQLLSEPSSVAVFRPPQVMTNGIVVYTNHIPWVDMYPPRGWWYPNIDTTNRSYLTNQ